MENGAAEGAGPKAEPSPHPDPLRSHRMGGEREQQGDNVSGSESQRHADVVRPAKVSDAAQRVPTMIEATSDAQVMRPTEAHVNPAMVKESGEGKKG
jgi:hypothetical protein